MKAKEKQEDFNMNLIKRMNIIEKKLDNGSGSSKSGSHMSPDEKIKSRSVSRHHQHFQRHSKRGTHNKSISFPYRKHKMSGWMN
jgi:hypothetical protein